MRYSKALTLVVSVSCPDNPPAPCLSPYCPSLSMLVLHAFVCLFGVCSLPPVACPSIVVLSCAGVWHASVFPPICTLS
jgi:hypothetical protein